MFLGKRYCLSAGKGVSKKHLPSFDKALVSAKVGNYNLVRLSSILPAECEEVSIDNIKDYIQEGSLLPVAYSTISSNTVGETIISSIGIGIPKNKANVGVIMEFSCVDKSEQETICILKSMIEEAFEIRGWELEEIKHICVRDIVDDIAEHTTFACVAEF